MLCIKNENVGRFIVVKSKFFNFKRNLSLFRFLRNSVKRISGEEECSNNLIIKS